MNFTFSTEDGGASVAMPIYFGTVAPSGRPVVNNTGERYALGLFITNDHTAALTECGFYIQPYAGTGYVGLGGESPDFLELLDWGTNGTNGLFLNQDAVDTDAPYDVAVSTDTGHAATNAFLLDYAAFTSTGTASSTAMGHFPHAQQGHITLILDPPAAATSAGLRQFSLFMKYEV